MMEIERPRLAGELIRATFDLYRRFPFLFLIFAAAVVVPYQLIVLAATGTGPNTARSLSTVEWMSLTITATVLVGPLISALHIHALNDVKDGRRPRIGSVARRSLKTLPVVTAAAIISWLGILAGFVALIVPGIILTLRWSVVAQAAALEDGGWIDALRRSAEVTRGNYEHIFGLFFLAGLAAGIPGIVVNIAFRHVGTTVPSFLIGTAYEVLARSFSALAAALLYFDLRARLRSVGDTRLVEHGAMPPRMPGGRVAEPTGHPLDPSNYTAEDRPHGWYVDPDDPGHMRYWPGDGPYGWSTRRARTPRKTLAAWRAHPHALDLRTNAPAAAVPTPPDPPAVEPTGHPLDPDSYSDADRPPGWYVIPTSPWRMSYWQGGDPRTGWSQKTAKTPKEIQKGWWKVSDR